MKKAMIDYIQIIGILMVIVFFVGFYMFTTERSVSSYMTQQSLSVHGMEMAVFNSLLSSPCTNNNYQIRSEVRKFIIDQNQAEIESENLALSCAQVGNIKYRIDIKDLESKNRWTFANYVPTEAKPIDPDFDMIVQINSNSIEPEFEGQYVPLDVYHVALLTASIEYNPDTTLLLDETYCEETSTDRVIQFLSADDNYIKNIYRYDTNDCLSENCIKGPGQLNATCQPYYCTYKNNVGEYCSNNCECKTFNCEDGVCAGDMPDKLVKGQPCPAGFEDSCVDEPESERLVCAINKRCTDNYDTVSNQLIVTVLDKDTEFPIPGVDVSIEGSDITGITDSDGDFTIYEYQIRELFGLTLDPLEIVTFSIDRPFGNKMLIDFKLTKDGYEDTTIVNVPIEENGDPRHETFMMEPTS